MDLHLNGQAAVVTGASRGIGLAVTRGLADLVLILASDRTANITGADITIDGGLIPTW